MSTAATKFSGEPVSNVSVPSFHCRVDLHQLLVMIVAVVPLALHKFQTATAAAPGRIFVHVQQMDL